MAEAFTCAKCQGIKVSSTSPSVRDTSRDPSAPHLPQISRLSSLTTTFSIIATTKRLGGFLQNPSAALTTNIQTFPFVLSANTSMDHPGPTNNRAYYPPAQDSIEAFFKEMRDGDSQQETNTFDVASNIPQRHRGVTQHAFTTPDALQSSYNTW